MRAFLTARASCLESLLHGAEPVLKGVEISGAGPPDHAQADPSPGV